MIEGSRATARIDVTDRGDGFIGGFARDEPGGEFLEKTEPGGKIFETFLPRKVYQRASREHVRQRLLWYPLGQLHCTVCS
jgi:hypothetical protein